MEDYTTNSCIFNSIYRHCLGWRACQYLVGFLTIITTAMAPVAEAVIRCSCLA